MKGIPTLVLFDEAGRVLTKEGRSLVQKPFPEWKSIIEEKKRSAAEMEARIATLPESVTIAAHAHPLAKRPSVYAGQYG